MTSYTDVLAFKSQTMCAGAKKVAIAEYLELSLVCADQLLRDALLDADACAAYPIMAARPHRILLSRSGERSHMRWGGVKP